MHGTHRDDEPAANVCTTQSVLQQGLFVAISKYSLLLAVVRVESAPKDARHIPSALQIKQIIEVGHSVLDPDFGLFQEGRCREQRGLYRHHAHRHGRIIADGAGGDGNADGLIDVIASQA